VLQLSLLFVKSKITETTGKNVFISYLRELTPACSMLCKIK